MQLGFMLDAPYAREYQAYQSLFRLIDRLDQAIANPYDTITAAAFTLNATARRTAWATLEAVVYNSVLLWLAWNEYHQAGFIDRLVGEMEALEVAKEYSFDITPAMLEAVGFEPEDLLPIVPAGPMYSPEYLASLTTKQLRELAEHHGIPTRSRGRFIAAVGLVMALQEVMH